MSQPSFNSMAGAADQSWSTSDAHFDPMATTDADFASFLDLDGIDLDLSMYDTGNGNSNGNGSGSGASAESSSNQQLAELAATLHMQHLVTSTEISPQRENNLSQAPSQQDASTLAGQSSHHFFDFNMAQFGQMPAQQPYMQPPFPITHGAGFPHHNTVPPTPNSVEMHADPAKYLQQMDAHTRAVMEQHCQLRNDDGASFTPLVSPAVTPHETRFNLQQDFTVPGAYFSPLTSPALEAQNQNNKRTYHGYQTSSSCATTSPADFDVDMLGESAVPAQESRKGKNQRAAPRNSRVRQSPMIKPKSRRKATLSAVIPPKEVSDLLEEAQGSRGAQASTAAQSMPSSSGASESDSISPEPLPEGAMPPPPRPGSRSVTHSPSIQAQRGRPTTVPHSGIHPATPASLMRLQSPNVPGSQQHSPAISPNTHAYRPNNPPLLEELSLPEPADQHAGRRPSLSRLDTSISTATDNQPTPRLHARKTPKLNAMSTPSGPVAMAGNPSPSPLLSAHTSPNSPNIVAGAGTGSRRSTTVKKRPSTSSTTPALISPAIRPKISPSIKPLLPSADGGGGGGEGGMGIGIGGDRSAATAAALLSEEAHALLLASKSNYQNLLDGTRVPGVSYPEALSEGLTSKRTSHKLAEQGRRQRINVALGEMARLLPGGGGGGSASPELVAAGEKGEKGAAGEKGAEKAASKAATVESAIVFIKELVREREVREREARERERVIEELRRRVRELEERVEGKGGGGGEGKEGEGKGVEEGGCGGEKEMEKVGAEAEGKEVEMRMEGEKNGEGETNTITSTSTDAPAKDVSSSTSEEMKT